MQLLAERSREAKAEPNLICPRMDKDDDGGAREQLQRLNASPDDEDNRQSGRIFFLGSIGFSDVGDGYRDEEPDHASSSHIPSGKQL